MATIVNTPATTEGSSSSGMGFLLGVIVLLLVLFALFYYGLPALRGATQGPTVNVPGKIDVNVNNPGNPGK